MKKVYKNVNWNLSYLTPGIRKATDRKPIKNYCYMEKKE